MRFDPHLAEIRFGYGLSPTVEAPDSISAMLAGVSGSDAMAAAYPIDTFEAFLPRMQDRTRLARIRRKNRGSPKAAEARQGINVLTRKARKDQVRWLAMHVARRVNSPAPFRERLEEFWADHFTAAGKMGLLRFAGSPYVESAIRPRLAGRFEDLLIAAVTHPLMVHYLDQYRSFGPRSEAAQGRGLNENLAREILELHTLGVDGPYTQTDVRELAKLLTGLMFNVRNGRIFRANRAEPGAETILGQVYGGDAPGMLHIEAVLRDLARHPVTARHICSKLAVHFVDDHPDPDIAASMAAEWTATNGDLDAVYAAMISHPSAWMGPGTMKPPMHFLASACRALGVETASLSEHAGQWILQPLALMGQPWQKPAGPDGLEEADSGWITPQSMAARLQWALNAPQALLSALPDPRVFVESALGARASEAVRFAAQAAESRADGVGLILASPGFQRS